MSRDGEKVTNKAALAACRDAKPGITTEQRDYLEHQERQLPPLEEQRVAAAERAAKFEAAREAAKLKAQARQEQLEEARKAAQEKAKARQEQLEEARKAAQEKAQARQKQLEDARKAKLKAQAEIEEGAESGENLVHERPYGLDKSGDLPATGAAHHHYADLADL